MALLTVAFIAATFVASFTVAAATANTASANPAIQVPWIVNNNDQRCIYVSSAADETPVRGGSCGSVPNKGWVFDWVNVDHFGDYYRIRNHSTGKCLLMRDWGSAANKGVQYPCLDYADQYWHVDFHTTSGHATIWNKNSGLCMVLRSWQTQVEGSRCGDYADQVWRVG
jgi:hypothetical protein